MNKELDWLSDGSVMPPPESLQELLANMTPAMFASLRHAVELGKFEDGSRLSAQQVENCLQLVILYEEQHLPVEQRTYSNLPQGCGANPVMMQDPAGRGK